MILAPRRHEQIVVSVVVVVGAAGRLPPAGLHDAGPRGDVLERAVPAIAIEMTGRSLTSSEPFEHRAVDNEEVEPAVAVDVENGDATAGRFEEVLVRLG